MSTVLVFKTSVSSTREVRKLLPVLNSIVRNKGHWNFDLEDCDNILRVETTKKELLKIQHALKRRGFYCEELAG